MSIARQSENDNGAASLANDASRLLAPLRSLRNRLVARVLIGELSATLLAAMGGALAVMILDLTLRWRTAAPRWMGTIAVVAILLSGLAATVIRRNWRVSILGLAERLEQLFPTLRGELWSAVSLAEAPSNDALAGSLRLRTNVIQRATTSLSKINISDSISLRSARMRPVFGAICLLGAAIWTLVAPDTVWRAARRFVAPWRVDAWPRLVVLELDAPSKIARGNDAAVVARSRTAYLPASATIWWSADDGEVLSQPMRREERQFAFVIPKLKSSIWLRVEGGDDDQMRWKRIEVVEPVTLSAARLEAFPPDYANAPSYRVGSDSILLEGTRLAMEFRASRPIREATPTFAGRRLGPLKIDSSGRRASGELIVEAPATSSALKLSIDVKDRENAVVLGAYTGAIKVIRDNPPQIEWREPKGTPKVQPATRLPFAARITDDVRVASLILRRRVIAATNESPSEAMNWREHASFALPDNAKQYSLSEEIDFAPLSLKTGDSVEWMLVAVDAKGQSKESEILRCAVVKIDDLRKDADRRFERILEQLRDAARRQGEVAQALRVAAELADQNNAQQLAKLRAARFDEQSLLEALSGNSGGVLESWQRWLAERQSHQLLSKEDRTRFELVTSDLTGIVNEQLPETLRQIDRTHAAIEAKELNDEAKQLAQGATNLHIGLQSIVDRLTNWRRQSQTSETIAGLLTAQQQLREKTLEAAPPLLGKLPEELTEAELASLKDLAEKQAALAQHLASLPPPGDSQQSWNGARGTASEEMRQAATDLARNQLNQAEKHQGRALEAMRQLANGSSQTAESGTSTPEQANTNTSREPNAAGPTEAQVREVLQRQSELRDKTKLALELLAKPGADKRQVQMELEQLAKEQSSLARQVEAWQAVIDAEQKRKEIAPRE